jgi:hypothetical protein
VDKSTATIHKKEVTTQVHNPDDLNINFKECKLHISTVFFSTWNIHVTCMTGNFGRYNNKNTEVSFSLVGISREVGNGILCLAVFIL